MDWAAGASICLKLAQRGRMNGSVANPEKVDYDVLFIIPHGTQQLDINP